MVVPLEILVPSGTAPWRRFFKMNFSRERVVYGFMGCITTVDLYQYFFRFFQDVPKFSMGFEVGDQFAFA